MTKEELQKQYKKILAERTALRLKVGAISLGGSLAGICYAHKQKESLIAKFAWFFVGATIVSIPTTLLYADKASDIEARLNEIKDELENNHGVEIID